MALLILDHRHIIFFIFHVLPMPTALRVTSPSGPAGRMTFCLHVCRRR